MTAEEARKNYKEYHSKFHIKYWIDEIINKNEDKLWRFLHNYHYKKCIKLIKKASKKGKINIVYSHFDEISLEVVKQRLIKLGYFVELIDFDLHISWEIK